MSLVAFPSFVAWSKIGPDFTILSGLKTEVTKKSFLQKCAPNLLFFNEKKIREIRMIFDFESPIFAKRAKVGKASQDAYNMGGWLIL